MILVKVLRMLEILSGARLDYLVEGDSISVLVRGKWKIYHTPTEMLTIIDWPSWAGEELK